MPLFSVPEGRPFDLLGIGQNSHDHVRVIDRIPAFGAKREAGSAHAFPGGQVATAVLAAQRQGLRCAYVGNVGTDSAAERVLAPLRDAGVELDGVERVSGSPTQTGLILVEVATGERSVVWHRDPQLAISDDQVARAPIESARTLLLDAGDPECALRAAERARAAGTAVLLDADRAEGCPAALLAAVDFPLVSRDFAEKWGDGSVRAGLRELVRLGARLAVATLGPLGALGYTGERWWPSPAFEVSARDTTGAGDAFHAGFARALLEGADEDGALRLANATAARNCEALGAQGGLVDREALERWLAAAKRRAWIEPELG